MNIYAPLTNHDANGDRWSRCHTVRVTPQYVRPAAPGRRRRPYRYELFDTLGQAFRYAETISHVREIVAEILDARTHLRWGMWQQQGDPHATFLNRTFGEADFTVSAHVAHRHRGGEFRGLFLVGFTVEGGGQHYESEWLSPLPHLDHRMANVKAVAEHRAALMARRVEVAP